MIKIKPHHFIDIIKLYGSGVNEFIPDQTYQHDFYSVANKIINNHQVELILTDGEDDICKPCKFISEAGCCTDSISHINHITSKDFYNKTLDNRLMRLMNLSFAKIYIASELCAIMYKYKDAILSVWKEESHPVTQRRYELFCAGSLRYLNCTAQNPPDNKGPA